jgi:hypothetical protein
MEEIRWKFGNFLNWHNIPILESSKTPTQIPNHINFSHIQSHNSNYLAYFKYFLQLINISLISINSLLNNSEKIMKKHGIEFSMMANDKKRLKKFIFYLFPLWAVMNSIKKDRNIKWGSQTNINFETQRFCDFFRKYLLDYSPSFLYSCCLEWWDSWVSKWVTIEILNANVMGLWIILEVINVGLAFWK